MFRGGRGDPPQQNSSPPMLTPWLRPARLSGAMREQLSARPSGATREQLSARLSGAMREQLSACPSGVQLRMNSPRFSVKYWRLAAIHSPAPEHAQH